MSGNLRRSFEARLRQERAVETTRASLSAAIHDQVVCGTATLFPTQLEFVGGHARSTLRVEALRNKYVATDLAEETRRVEMYGVASLIAPTSTCRLEEAEAQRRSRHDCAAALIRSEVEKGLVLSEEAREEQERRRIVSESAELKALKSRLTNALVNRDRAAQILEKRYREEVRGREEREMDMHLLREVHREQEFALQEEADKFAKRELAKLTQLAQMAERERQNESLLEHFKSEKLAMEAKLEEAKQADADEHEARLRKGEEVRSHLRAFMVEESERKIQRKQAEVEEQMKITEFQRKLEERETRLASERTLREKERADASQTVANQLQKARLKERELEALKNDLYHEQMQVKQAENDKQRRARDDFFRQEMRKHNEEHSKRKEASLHERRFEEDRVRRELLDEFEQSQKFQQLSDQKRREKMVLFNREISSMIERKRAEFIAMKDLELAKIEKDQTTLHEYNRVVENERRIILAKFNSTVNRPGEP